MTDLLPSALTDRSRPKRDLARDLRDRTADVLRFAGIQPSWIVADFLPFRGYFTRLFSSLVGETGHVYAIIPERLMRIERLADDKAQVEAVTRGRGNVSILDGAPEAAGSPAAALDLFWIAQNYHDLQDRFMGPGPHRLVQRGRVPSREAGRPICRGRSRRRDWIAERRHRTASPDRGDDG